MYNNNLEKYAILESYNAEKRQYETALTGRKLFNRALVLSGLVGLLRGGYYLFERNAPRQNIIDSPKYELLEDVYEGKLLQSPYQPTSTPQPQTEEDTSTLANQPTQQLNKNKKKNKKIITNDTSTYPVKQAGVPLWGYYVGLGTTLVGVPLFVNRFISSTIKKHEENEEKAKLKALRQRYRTELARTLETIKPVGTKIDDDNENNINTNYVQQKQGVDQQDLEIINKTLGFVYDKIYKNTIEKKAFLPISFLIKAPFALLPGAVAGYALYKTYEGQRKADTDEAGRLIDVISKSRGPDTAPRLSNINEVLLKRQLAITRQKLMQKLEEENKKKNKINVTIQNQPYQPQYNKEQQ